MTAAVNGIVVSIVSPSCVLLQSMPWMCLSWQGAVGWLGATQRTACSPALQ